MDFKHFVETKCKCDGNGEIIGHKVSSRLDVGYFMEANGRLCPFKNDRKVAIWRYCFERLLNTFKRKHFKLSVRSGPCGVEVDDIRLKSYYEEILVKFLELRDPRDCLEYSLAVEYGYVMDQVRDKNWSIITIPTNYLASNVAQRKFDVKRLHFYTNNPPDIHCVCTERESNYFVHDGHHRVRAAMNMCVSEIRLLLGT